MTNVLNSWKNASTSMLPYLDKTVAIGIEHILKEIVCFEKHNAPKFGKW